MRGNNIIVIVKEKQINITCCSIDDCFLPKWKLNFTYQPPHGKKAGEKRAKANIEEVLYVCNACIDCISNCENFIKEVYAPETKK